MRPIDPPPLSPEELAGRLEVVAKWFTDRQIIEALKAGAAALRSSRIAGEFRGQPAYAVCRCGHWETAHDQDGRCTICPNPEHRYEFYEYLHELRSSRIERETTTEIQEKALARPDQSGDVTSDLRDGHRGDLIALIEKAFRCGFYFPRTWLSDPEKEFTGETAWEFYREKQLPSDFGYELARAQRADSVHELSGSAASPSASAALKANVNSPLSRSGKAQA